MGRVWNFTWPYLREIIVFITAIAGAIVLAIILAAASMLFQETSAKEALGGQLQFLLGMATMWWARRT